MRNMCVCVHIHTIYMDVGYFSVKHFENVAGEFSWNIHVTPDGVFTSDFMVQCFYLQCRFCVITYSTI